MRKHKQKHDHREVVAERQQHIFCNTLMMQHTNTVGGTEGDRG
jgi:hypothetical protein